MIIKNLLAMILAFSMSANATVSQSDFDNAYATANGTLDERKDFLSFVLKNQDQANSFNLFFAARNAMEIGDLRDSGFLFYAAQLRGRLDFFRYPVGSDNAKQVTASIHRALGDVINPAIMQDPKDYMAILERIKQWDVVPVGDYSPGWLSEGERSSAEVRAEAEDLKSSLVTYMSDFSKLLQIPEYHKAMIEIRAYNEGETNDGEASDESYDANKNTIQTIEREHGVVVLSDLM